MNVFRTAELSESLISYDEPAGNARDMSAMLFGFTTYIAIEIWTGDTFNQCLAVDSPG